MKVKDGMTLNRVVNQNIAVDLTGRFTGTIKLNETAAEIWRGVAEGKSVSDIADCFTKKYNIGREKAQDDAEKFIREMVELGFFEQ